jgi:hypothetical protein
VTRLRLLPVTITRARGLVARLHSHHHAPPSGLCAVGVAFEGEADPRCVAILSRPVARVLQSQGCAEVTRVASDRTPHAASMAIAAIARAALALGYRRLVSYTLLGEAGTSYRAAGWWPVMVGQRREGWGCPSRPRGLPAQPGAKVRWEFGPGALPRDDAADHTVREMVGKVEIPPRAPDALPLFDRRPS